MPRYDLCLAWNWEYDLDFVRLLEAACTRRGLTLLQVTPETLPAVLAALARNELAFGAFFDRAVESDARFQPLVDAARLSGAFLVNPQERCLWAADKATMHLELISHGLETPYTLLLSPYAEQPELPPLDLSLLGSAFAIKPASGGGGWGVVLEATTLEQVRTARHEYPQEKLLLQAHVRPQQLEARPAWFRVLVCDGAVYASWWDLKTHVYTRLSAEQRARFGLRAVSEVARRIAQISCMDLFSTEIALTADGRFVVVDYVNDPVDLRLQSRAADGVPDAFVENIAARLARLVERKADK